MESDLKPLYVINILLKYAMTQSYLHLKELTLKSP